MAHTVQLVNFTDISSTANQLYTSHLMLVKESCEDELVVEGNDEKAKYISSMVCHAVLWTRDSRESNNAAIVHKLTQDKLAQSSVNAEDIPQVDGIVDEEGSDEETEEKESKVLCDETSNNSADHEMENDDSNGG